MDAVGIAKESVQTLWAHKRLWVLGFFAAAGSGGGGAGGGDGSGGGTGEIPGWVIGLLIGAVVAAIVGLFLHVVSESALIDSVRSAREGGAPRLRPAFRRGLRWFGRILGIKAIAFVAALVSISLVALPTLLAALEVVPVWLGVGVTVLLALPAVPWLLTIYFVYEWSMRFAVLEDRSAIESLRAGKRFLHGRLAASLKLLVMDAVGQMAGGLVGLLVVLPGALLGLGVYLAAGLVPALVVGAVAALPFAAAVAGARGVYRSSLWTIGWLEERGALG